MTSQAQQPQSIASLYCLKAICALLVVAIHAPVGEYREVVNSIASFAVPLFFTISGYFLWDQDSTLSQSKLLNAIKRLVPTLLITHAVYSVLPHTGFPLGKDLTFYIKWVLTGVNHNNMHLWYLHSLLWSLAILYLTHRLGWRRIIPLLILLVPIHYWLSGFVFTTPQSPYWTSTACFFWRYTLATALGYIALGCSIKRYEVYLPKAYRITALALPLYVLIVSPLGKGLPLIATILKPLSIILSVYAIFALCLDKRALGSGSLVAYIGDKLSGNIYYWHILVMYVLSHHLTANAYQNWGIFYTFVFSSLLAYIIYRLQQGIGITLLR